MLKCFLNELDEVESYLTKYLLKTNQYDDIIGNKCRDKCSDNNSFITFDEFVVFIRLLASLLGK